MRLITKRDAEDMLTAFNATSSRSLPGVDIRNSGSQVFSLVLTNDIKEGFM
jgi:hypothetical protein